MKILHVTDYLPNYHKVWGGAEQAALRFIKLLKKNGYHDLTVCGTTALNDVKEDFEYIPLRTTEDFFGERLSLYISGIKNRLIPFDPISFFYFYRVLMRLKPSLIHFHRFNRLSLSLLLSAKLNGIKTIVTIYDYWYFCPGSYFIDRSGKRCEKYQGIGCIACDVFPDFKILSRAFSVFRKPIIEIFIKMVDAFSVLSVSSYELLKNYGIGEKKLFLTHQLFDIKDYENIDKVDQEPDTILYVGWVDHIKGLHIILEAMPAILKEIPDAKLYAIGPLVNEEYEKRIKDIIAKNLLDKKVFMLGKKDFCEAEKYFKKSSVVVVPEQWENMSPVVLVEAMVHGKPVVASRIGGIPEFVEDGITGFLADPADPNDFAKKIVGVMKNRDKALSFGEAAKRGISTKCSEEISLKEIKNMYDKVSYGRQN